jgi:c-di-GMP-related signal transduction protein
MGQTGAKTALNSNEGTHLRYVARQPILGADEQVFGYELLFRDGVEDYFRNPDAEDASRSVLDTSILLGLDVLCDGRHAFINCTRDILLKDYITLLPPQLAVIEVLESVPPDDLVIEACRRLKRGGYMIALDDFQLNDPREPLAEYADIIKVDVRESSPEQTIALIKRFGARSRMLAEKVETREEFVAAQKAGFVYFQGYFFCRPALMQARDIPANRLNYLRLMQALSKEEMDSREVENIIKSEAALCYRLLRYLNSAAFGFSTEIQSVGHGLAILGEREVRRWIRLVATLTAGQNKSRELVQSALVRARFCELLSPKIKPNTSDLFLVGLLSLMDTILEISMPIILENIPVDREAKAVLLGENSNLSPLFHLMLAHETGDWKQIKELCGELHLQESFVAQAHWQAMLWAKQVSGGA